MHYNIFFVKTQFFATFACLPKKIGKNLSTGCYEVKVFSRRKINLTVDIPVVFRGLNLFFNAEIG